MNSLESLLEFRKKFLPEPSAHIENYSLAACIVLDKDGNKVSVYPLSTEIKREVPALLKPRTRGISCRFLFDEVEYLIPSIIDYILPEDVDRSGEEYKKKEQKCNDYFQEHMAMINSFLSEFEDDSVSIIKKFLSGEISKKDLRDISDIILSSGSDSKKKSKNPITRVCFAIEGSDRDVLASEALREKWGVYFNKHKKVSTKGSAGERKGLCLICGERNKALSPLLDSLKLEKPIFGGKSTNGYSFISFNQDTATDSGRKQLENYNICFECCSSIKNALEEILSNDIKEDTKNGFYYQPSRHSPLTYAMWSLEDDIDFMQLLSGDGASVESVKRVFKSPSVGERPLDSKDAEINSMLLSYDGTKNLQFRDYQRFFTEDVRESVKAWFDHMTIDIFCDNIEDFHYPSIWKFINYLINSDRKDKSKSASRVASVLANSALFSDVNSESKRKYQEFPKEFLKKIVDNFYKIRIKKSDDGKNQRNIPLSLICLFRLVFHRTIYCGDYIMKDGLFKTNDCRQAYLWGKLYSVYEGSYESYHQLKSKSNKLFAPVFKSAMENPQSTFSRIQGRFRVYVGAINKYRRNEAGYLISCWDNLLIDMAGDFPKRMGLEQRAAFEYGVAIQRQEINKEKKERIERYHAAKEAKEASKEKPQAVLEKALDE